MNVKERLKRYEIEPKEYMDQYFLSDENILEREVKYANIDSNDVILEIGPGIGNLTEKLAEKAEEVIAVERDKKLYEALLEMNPSNLKLIRGDVLDVRLPGFDKIVSNLPYGISSPLTERILGYEWEVAVLTYQKEFAERFVAGPGDSDYSRLSVLVQYFCDVELLEEISKTKFYPRPDVDSAIVKLEQKQVKKGDNKFFWKLVRECFRHKNKKVKNSLKASSHVLDISEDWLKSKNKDIFEKKVFQCKIEDFKELESILSRN